MIIDLILDNDIHPNPIPNSYTLGLRQKAANTNPQPIYLNMRWDVGLGLVLVTGIGLWIGLVV